MSGFIPWGKQEWAQRQQIEFCLQKMHRSPEHLQAYQILQGGISGATTYHRRLEAETRKQLPFALLHQVLDALELRAWLLVWPDYLMDASPQWMKVAS